MEIPEFRIEDFTLEEDFLKEGDQANVFKGLHSTHGEVAIKKWFSSSDDMKKEVELLRKNTYHENIIQFLGILIDEQSECIGYVMPFMAMGSLHDAIHNKSKQYDQEQIKSWITKICYGLSYLHDKQIIHRDVKPSNVLLGASYDDVKLSDFGMVRSLENIQYPLTGGVGTLFYMAPEVLKEEKYDFSVDVYSLSITIWEILYRKLPYDHAIWIIEFASKIIQGERPQLESNLSKEESDLLMRCWDGDASKRPTVDYIREFYRKTTFSFIDLENSVKEFVPSFEHLNVNNNTNNESCYQIITANNAESANAQNKSADVPTTASNNNESLAQTPLNKPKENFPILKRIEESPEEQTILLLGGVDGNDGDSLLLLENNGQNWKELNIKLPYPIEDHGAQFLNNNLYMFGGKGEEGPLHWTYKLSKSLQWEKMADMNTKRSEISNSSVVLNSQIWVCGGGDDNGNTLQSVEMYDPEMDQWKYMKEMNEGRWNATAAVVSGKIFCSGWDISVECYDPSSDVWTLICNMPREISGHGAVEIDGNFITIGGCDFPDSLNNVWALDTTDRDAVWIEKPSMSISRRDFSIAQIHGKIFVCGGETESMKSIDAVEVFDGEVWRKGPKMPTPRNCAPAVVIPIAFASYLN